MEDLPEEAVRAAAQAIFDHSILAGQSSESKARQWLTEAGDYREIARVALTAALPYLKAR
jgi:hypothetical protein